MCFQRNLQFRSNYNEIKCIYLKPNSSNQNMKVITFTWNFKSWKYQ